MLQDDRGVNLDIDLIRTLESIDEQLKIANCLQIIELEEGDIGVGLKVPASLKKTMGEL